MRKLHIHTIVVLMVSTGLVLPVAVSAHGGATGVVKERMDAMGMMGKAVKVLKAMMQGKVAYDASVVRKQAAIIKHHAGEALTKDFPPGLIQMPSEAKSEIWTDWERFSNMAGQLESYATGLILAADNGLAGKQSQSLGKSATMGSMMGGSSSGMMGKDKVKAGQVDGASFGKMPANAVFTKMVQVCSACHTDFRLEKKK